MVTLDSLHSAAVARNAIFKQIGTKEFRAASSCGAINVYFKNLDQHSEPLDRVWRKTRNVMKPDHITVPDPECEKNGPSVVKEWFVCSQKRKTSVSVCWTFISIYLTEAGYLSTSSSM